MGRDMNQIAAEMKQDLAGNGIAVGDHITSPVSTAYIETTAHQVELTEYAAEQVYKRCFVDTDTEEGLEKRLDERGLPPRFPGSKAKGNILLGKSSPFIIGSSIKAGTEFKSMDGKIKYTVTQDTDITTGTLFATVTVLCTDIGTAGNQLPSTLLTYSGIAINEVETITVDSSGITGGIDQESVDQMKRRLHDDMQKKGTSGNVNQYVEWAKDNKNVGDAICIPLWNGANTVKVIIIDVNKLPAPTGLVEEVQGYIDPGCSGLGYGKAGIGAFVTVTEAEGVSINVAASLTIKSGYTINQVKTSFADAFTPYLQSIAFQPDNTVRYSRFGPLLLDTVGVIDYTNLLINGGTSNININVGCVAVPGMVNFT